MIKMKNNFAEELNNCIEEVCDADKRVTNKDTKLFADTITIEIIENAMKAVK